MFFALVYLPHVPLRYHRLERGMAVVRPITLVAYIPRFRKVHVYRFPQLLSRGRHHAPPPLLLLALRIPYRLAACKPRHKKIQQGSSRCLRRDSYSGSTSRVLDPGVLQRLVRGVACLGVGYQQVVDEVLARRGHVAEAVLGELELGLHAQAQERQNERMRY